MSLKVIGAGLGRTGTFSLKFALEHLGFGPCYHMVEVMRHARAAVAQWTKVTQGKPDWATIFEGYEATVDHPACGYWRELAEFYPDAKIVLSTRDPEAWYKSVHETIYAPGFIASLGGTPLGAFMEGMLSHLYGTPLLDRITDRDFMVAAFKRYEAEVIAGVPASRLLIHRPGDGWEPLCEFLGVALPVEPFPRVNERQDLKDANLPGMPNTPESLEQFGQAYLEAMKAKAF